MERETPKIGYVLGRFPKLSETFILSEILQLERQGGRLQVFSLREPLDEPLHGVLKEVQSAVTYLPQDAQPEGWVRERNFTDGSSREWPFKEVLRKEKGLQRLVSPDVLRGLLNRLAKRIRKLDDLPIFAAQVRALPQAAALAVLAKGKGVKHLHAHFGGTIVSMVASRLSRLPYSFSAHAADIYHQDVNRALLAEKISRARFVVTCTEYNRRFLAELSGAKAARKIIQVYHGVDMARVRRDPSVPREPDLILAIGRLVEKKGFHDLVRACRVLQDKECPFRCLIVGEGEERDRLIQQIDALGIRDRVILAGARPQEQVLNMMQEATVLVLPCVMSASGDQDGLPNVLVEALAVGLPAISTPLSGIPELIEHGKTGLLVPPGDPISLAATIEQVLGDLRLRQRLARAGLKQVKERFDIQKNIQTLQDQFTHFMLTPAGAGV
ncbi:MAG: glycosyltransferase family 4 protein [Candidatus Binatia bacterium]